MTSFVPAPTGVLWLNEHNYIYKFPILPSGTEIGFFKFLTPFYYELSKKILSFFYLPLEFYERKITENISNTHSPYNEPSDPRFLTLPLLSIEKQDELNQAIESLIGCFMTLTATGAKFDWPKLTPYIVDRQDLLKMPYDSYLYTACMVVEVETFLQHQITQYQQLIQQWDTFFHLIEAQHWEAAVVELLIAQETSTLKASPQRHSLFRGYSKKLNQENLTPLQVKEIYHSFKTIILNPLLPEEKMFFEEWRQKFEVNSSYLSNLTQVYLGEQPFFDSIALIEELPALIGLPVCYIPALITTHTHIVRFFAEDYQSGHIQATFNFEHCLGIFFNKKVALNICQQKFYHASAQTAFLSAQLTHDNALAILEYRYGVLKYIHCEPNEVEEELNVLLNWQHLGQHTDLASAKTKTIHKI